MEAAAVSEPKPKIATARVWNDHDKEHVERFNEKEIRIPARGFILMPWAEAVNFRGQFSPVQRDGMGNDLRPKKIRLEKVEAGVPEYPVPEGFVCQKDGKSFDSQDELDKYIVANYWDELDDDAKKKLSKLRPKVGK